MFHLYVFLITLVFCLIVIPIGLVVGVKLYRNIRNEEHKEKGKVIQTIMKNYALIQCITWPTVMMWFLFLYLNQLIQIIPPSFMSHVVSLSRFLATLNTDYISFNSLIIAMCRYCFIVFDGHAESFGIQKLKKLFIMSSIGIPIFRTFLQMSTVPIEKQFLHYFVSCTFCGNDSYQNVTHTSISTPEDIGNNIGESTAYIIVNEYFPAVIISGMKQANFFLVVLFYSNIIEGFIYMHTFMYSNR